jgi:preprotein translocase subunit SecD
VKLTLFLCPALLSIAFLACSGDSGPSTTLVLQADLSKAPEGRDSQSIMQDVANVIQTRGKGFGANDVEIDIQDMGRLSVKLTGIASSDEAGRLLQQIGALEFREPATDEGRMILCSTASGVQFKVARFALSETTDKNGRKFEQCPTSDGHDGEVIWTSVGPIPIQSVAYDTVGRQPTVQVTFTSDGGAVFEHLTARLQGLPLGIFMDGQLISAPTVQQTINAGNVAIAGLSEDEARALAALLNGGTLPVPVTVVSAQANS